eukprot:TRINITY_DN2723_c0_g2_i1.p1 TRINITY_DN2723_c0_g2~~TRINITY_DN2723_c0_g2_i1.p1  ORF type:complete len:565 (+),score=164.88 TRINITY_DN2723_c0_g2_i1:73-1767(+)
MLGLRVSRNLVHRSILCQSINASGRLSYTQIRNLATEAPNKPSENVSTSPSPTPAQQEVVVTPSPSPSSSSSNNQKKRITKWKVMGFLVVAGVVGYFTDLYMNDDMEILTDRWRKKISAEERKERPRVVILGGGWAALNMIRKLHADEFQVTVVSPRNYFLFTPLLPGTTTGRVEMRSIMEPIRKYCHRSDSEEATFIEAECVKIDAANKTISCKDNSAVKGTVSAFDLPYDQLIVAVGGEPATFGVPGVKENAVFMKEIDDARTIRDRILDCFETASIPGQPKEEIERLLNFVVVGGGPSGVEYTAELNDFLLSDLTKAFPHVASSVKITLIEALPHILNVFDKKLIDYVEGKFGESTNIKVWTNTSVTHVGEKTLVLKDKSGTRDMPYGTLVWVTGNTPRPVIKDFMASLGPVQNQRRGIVVDEFFRVVGADGVWAIGDCAATKFSATAQVASQQGRYLGRLFNNLSDDMYNDVINKTNTTPEMIKKQTTFAYHHWGSFAYIGQHKAVGEFRTQDKITATGWITYVLWRSVYVTKLLSLKNRVLVVFDWMKTGVFGRDISRG